MLHYNSNSEKLHTTTIKNYKTKKYAMGVKYTLEIRRHIGIHRRSPATWPR